MRYKFLQIIEDLQNRRRVRPIIREVIEDFSEIEGPCDLTYIIKDRLSSLDIPFRLFLIKTEPKGHDLGHINLTQQYGHTVLEIGGRIFDPYYLIKELPLRKYLVRVYRPQNEIEIITQEL